MPEPTSYPYATHVNVRFKTLELVDLQSPVDARTDRWYDQAR